MEVFQVLLLLPSFTLMLGELIITGNAIFFFFFFLPRSSSSCMCLLLVAAGSSWEVETIILADDLVLVVFLVAAQMSRMQSRSIRTIWVRNKINYWKPFSRAKSIPSFTATIIFSMGLRWSSLQNRFEPCLFLSLQSCLSPCLVLASPRSRPPQMWWQCLMCWCLMMLDDAWGVGALVLDVTCYQSIVSAIGAGRAARENNWSDCNPEKLQGEENNGAYTRVLRFSAGDMGRGRWTRESRGGYDHRDCGHRYRSHASKLCSIWGPWRAAAHAVYSTAKFPRHLWSCWRVSKRVLQWKDHWSSTFCCCCNRRWSFQCLSSICFSLGWRWPWQVGTLFSLSL